jgi:hypothetical protein
MAEPLAWLVLAVAVIYGVCWAVQCVLDWLVPDEE